MADKHYERSHPTENVVGAIHAESGHASAFDEDLQTRLETVARPIRPLWDAD